MQSAFRVVRNDYLEQKKKAFPRFYFVANGALLDILSNGNKPLKALEEKINPHVFLRMEFAKGQKNKCELTQKHHILQSSIPISSDVKFLHVSLLLTISW